MKWKSKTNNSRAKRYGVTNERVGSRSCTSYVNEQFRSEVAEKPEELVVYGGIGRAARNWESYNAIVDSLKTLESDETLLVQSGKPVAIFKSHEDAPRVLLANSNLVPKWANWDRFRELEKKVL